MTKAEYKQRKRLREREERRKRQEAWEAARGPLDLPFLLLALLLLGIGLIMLLSASFPSAQASKSSNYDPLYYFKRQAMFGALGLFAMFTVSKINYERFRGLAKLGIILFFGDSIARRREKMGTFREGFLPHFLLLCLTAGQIGRAHV